MSAFGATEFKKTETVVIVGIDGKPLLSLHDVQKMRSSGLDTEKESSCETIELSDGRLWNPAMNPRGPTLLGGICSFCQKPPFRLLSLLGLFGLFRRRKPTHGVCSLDAGQNCDKCGSFTCPRHRELGEDGLWRCPKCKGRQRRKAIVHSLFLEDVPEGE